MEGAREKSQANLSAVQGFFGSPLRKTPLKTDAGLIIAALYPLYQLGNALNFPLHIFRRRRTDDLSFVYTVFKVNGLVNILAEKRGGFFIFRRCQRFQRFSVLDAECHERADRLIRVAEQIGRASCRERV